MSLLYVPASMIPWLADGALQVLYEENLNIWITRTFVQDTKRPTGTMYNAFSNARLMIETDCLDRKSQY